VAQRAAMARYILYRMTCRIADTSRRLPRYESLNRNLLQGKRIAVNSAIFPITGSLKSPACSCVSITLPAAS